MALPAYSPKVGVISGAEESLGLAATDPMKAGVALPLLFGAQAVRQDADQSYNENNLFQRQLAQQIQDQTNAHQVRSDRATGLNISQPGGAALYALDPGSGIDLNDPQTLALINAMSKAQFRGADAKAFSEYGSGIKSSVEAGYVPPTDAVSSMYGFVPTATDPLQLRVEGMRQAGQNARAAAERLAVSEPSRSVGLGADGKPTLTISGKLSGDQVNQAMTEVEGYKNNPPTTYTGTDGKTYVVPGTYKAPSLANVVNSRTKEVIRPYTGGPVTRAAPGGATASPTTSAPPAGVTNPPVDAIKPIQLNAQQTAQLKQEYVKARGAGKTGAEAAAVATAQVGIGEVPGGKRYVTVNGKLLQPLVPVN